MSGANQSARVLPFRQTSTESDATLVAQVRDGKRHAQEALFRRHAKLAMGLAYRLMPEEDPQDIAHDAFLNAFTRIVQLRNPEQFSTWLGGIVVFEVRRRLRRRRLLNRLGFGDARDDEVEVRPAPSASPETKAALTDLYRGLSTLSTEERLAVLLYRVEGYELTEVAGALDLSLATVKRRITAADQKLEEVRHG
ncbi:MAG: sigma-70 family RNA polymerase sigma factor [Myxococcaceae bacterium]|nr:sigma-70 family RNA polymerase sigma factor [Myxococcaceae bacterium]